MPPQVGRRPVPRQWAIQAVRLDAEGPVKPGAEILQGGGGRQLDELRFVKMRAQAGEQRVGDVRRHGRHGVGQFERRALGICIQRARPEFGQDGDLLVGHARVAAAGSVDVDSEGAADQRRHPQADQ